MIWHLPDSDTKWRKHKFGLHIFTKVVSLVFFFFFFFIYITVTFDVAPNDLCQGINSQVDWLILGILSVDRDDLMEKVLNKLCLPEEKRWSTYRLTESIIENVAENIDILCKKHIG